MSQDRAFLKADLKASLVVFLVAVPLCLGIALASGVPPAAGLLAGVVGGLIVGFLSGCPLQVSGPAAGLVVIVWEIVNSVGLKGLCAAVILGGLLQIGGAWLRLGRWFQAVSPAVVQGMLTSIGILIVLSQLHTVFDVKPSGGGPQNIVSLFELLTSPDYRQTKGLSLEAGLIGLSSLLILVGWPYIPRVLKWIPPALFVVSFWTISTSFGLWSIQRVEVPLSIVESFRWDGLQTLLFAPDLKIILAGLTIAVVASAESLLSCGAVQRLAPLQKVDYNKELFAQGCGNLASGLLGGLPLTGVIVRSAANISAGAQTRFSTMFHGLWILLFVCFAPRLLNMVPTSVLAGVLLYFGGKLIKIKAFSEFAKTSRSEAYVFLGTILAIVMTDLLSGVIFGIGLSLLRLAIGASHLDIHIRKHEEKTYVHLSGVASFLSLPRLDSQLETLSKEGMFILDTQQLRSIDQACFDLLQHWAKGVTDAGGELEVMGPNLESLQLRLIRGGQGVAYVTNSKSA